MLDALSDRKRCVARGPASDASRVPNGFRDGDNSQLDEMH